MNWLKQNWIKIGVICLVFVTSFYFWNKEEVYKNTAAINNAIQTPTATSTVSRDDPRILAIEQSLPRFEDYPAKVYLIPPKALVDHESNPYGMTYWTVTEIEMASSAMEYNMGGHYLMERYATGNPDVLIIDGLTGKIFHEFGSLYPASVANSSLVIFDPVDPECFSSDGDYDSCYDISNPRYAVWDGKQFVTICEPVIKNWKVISCGEVSDKGSELYGKRKIAWAGTVAAKMTYGRLRIKTNQMQVKQYGYSEFIVEPNDIDDTVHKASATTADINVGDFVRVYGYWTNTDNIPWISIDKIYVQEEYKPE